MIKQVDYFSKTKFLETSNLYSINHSRFKPSFSIVFESEMSLFKYYIAMSIYISSVSKCLLIHLMLFITSCQLTILYKNSKFSIFNINNLFLSF